MAMVAHAYILEKQKTEASQQTRIEKVGSKKWIPDEWPNVIYMAFEHKRFQTYVVAYIEVKLAVR